MVQWLGLGTFTGRAWVQSLVGEIRSCKLRGMAKLKKKKAEWGEKLEMTFFRTQAQPRSWPCRRPREARESQHLQALVRASGGRLDRLVDVSVTHGVWVSLVGGQSLEAGGPPRPGGATCSLDRRGGKELVASLTHHTVH